MRLFILLAICLLPISAVAQSSPPIGIHDVITVTGAGTGNSTMFDTHGNSVNFIGDEHGGFATARDSSGHTSPPSYISTGLPYPLHIPPMSPIPWDDVIPGAKPAQDHLFDGPR